jgi:DNA-binding MarR family transcriptional regulator
MMSVNHSKYCDCLYYSCNALSRVLTKMADEAFSTTGLSSSYAFLLMIVNDKPGVQPKEISEQMQLTPSTVTRLVERMEFRGYLTRTQVGRSTEVYPTQLSQELNPTIKTAWKSLFERYSNLIGKEESQALTAKINDANVRLSSVNDASETRCKNANDSTNNK